MSNESIVCPKCNSAMEAGFILDRGDYNSRAISQWVEGAPEHGFWGDVKTRRRKKYQVTTYRCAGCGYIESYALVPEY